MEATVAETNTYRFLGLSATTNTDAGYTNITYGIDLYNNGTIAIYESGEPKGSFGTYATCDKIRISVENNIVKYYKNYVNATTVPLYNSSKVPVLPLLADISLYTTGATMKNVNIYNPATTLTFTATPTNGGTIPAYAWKVNGVAVGTNSATFSSASLQVGNVVTCHLTSNIACTANNPAISNAITISSSSCRIAPEELKEGQIGILEVYPNPATNEFLLVLPPSETASSIQLVDILGHVVKEQTTHATHTFVNSSELRSGIYLIYSPARK